MRRLAPQPREVRHGHGIPRRMRAQHQTQMTVHVRKLNRGMFKAINKQNNKSRGELNYFKEFKKFQLN
jgi:hypothetical protein